MRNGGQFVAHCFVRRPVSCRLVTAVSATDSGGTSTEPGDAPIASESDATLGPLTTSIVWATWALFVGLGLMLSGAGLFGTVVGIRAEREGFSALTIGLIIAAYYLGFLVGSRVALKALGNVGHIRVYAALASVLAATIMVAGMAVTPYAWIALRLVAGACLAGQFVVAESWLNQLVTNSNRGRILSMYSLTTIVAYGLGQVSVTIIDPETLTAFGIGAVVISLAVAPVALSAEAAPPITAIPDRMSMRELFSIVPTGVIASALVGIAHGSFLGLGAVYATQAGLSATSVGIFVAMPTVGSLVLQVPIAAASDDIDRRAVGAFAALTAAGGATMLLVVGPDTWLGYAAMALIGGTTYPLYSIAGAYTNDWIPAEKLTAVASQLVIVFGAGAFIGPIATSLVMGAIGQDGYIWSTIAIHGAIGVFLIVRIAQWRAPMRAKPWNEVAIAARVFYIPATVVGTGRRIRAARNRRVPPPGDESQ